jgi:DNA helicase-2/ATP-dependent DNA helicase PcrA
MFDMLSEKQREIVFDKTGKFAVRACPGSGKTFCVSARLARLIDEWRESYQGIAALSFTNVAWQEIQRKYTEKFAPNKTISHPHFLGTIDSFINKYIFLPYGHLILRCSGRPTLVGEPHGIWTGHNFSYNLFDNISYKIDGSLYAHNPRRMPSGWSTNRAITQAKTNINRGGYATQSDANYFALRILETYPQIAKALAFRFPYLIVDEAQDTSDIQMKIIDILIENGLDEAMLVGDPDQAIFEWNDARPDLLVQKFEQWENSIVLNENRRSSQLICNSTHKISSLDSASTSVDEDVRDFPLIPSIVVYNNNLPQVVQSFLDECTRQGIVVNKENVAVLYRSKSIINDITGVAEVPDAANPWGASDNYTRDFAKGKFLYDSGDVKEGFKSMEKAILKLLKGLSFCSQEIIEISSISVHTGTT